MASHAKSTPCHIKMSISTNKYVMHNSSTPSSKNLASASSSEMLYASFCTVAAPSKAVIAHNNTIKYHVTLCWMPSHMVA